MRVEHTIHIEAPPELVWEVTRDVERWPEWTPTVTSVKRSDRGSFGLGSAARVKQPLQPGSEWVVTEYEEGRRFAWKSSRRGIRMTGRHEISPADAGTRNTLSVEAEGILAALLWPVLRLAVARALSDENRGLKAHCERSRPARP